MVSYIKNKDFKSIYYSVGNQCCPPCKSGNATPPPPPSPPPRCFPGLTAVKKPDPEVWPRTIQVSSQFWTVYLRCNTGVFPGWCRQNPANRLVACGVPVISGIVLSYYGCALVKRRWYADVTRVITREYKTGLMRISSLWCCLYVILLPVSVKIWLIDQFCFIPRKSRIWKKISCQSRRNRVRWCLWRNHLIMIL